LRPAPPAYQKMSATNMRPIHSQSHPTTPPGATMTNIIVVQGRKIMPSTGQIHQRPPLNKLLKAVSQRSGRNSHHSAPKKRGPSKTSVKNTHHMVNPPQSKLRQLSIHSQGLPPASRKSHKFIKFLYQPNLTLSTDWICSVDNSPSSLEISRISDAPSLYKRD